MSIILTILKVIGIILLIILLIILAILLLVLFVPIRYSAGGRKEGDVLEFSGKMKDGSLLPKKNERINDS